ncbi:MAG TPA: restriction endonuclease fold toxin-2 domain-containing protein [Archangium sp.]|nr:restriction endonuclease fold toxin-2 domain-containing protein [Archangium sp.]
MRFIAFCLGLLLAMPAVASSVEDAICGSASAPVVRMAGSEKLCRASVRSFSALPAATHAELRALLTPENLSTMMALTSVWLGTQGVPVVGEAVDLALVTLGVALVAVQAGEVTQALWSFANLALTARTHDDLKKAASSLAWAVSKVGVNVVAFVLTKKMASAVARPRGPPSEPPLVTSEGPFAPAVGAAPAMARPVAPAAMASGMLSQGSGSSRGGEHSSAQKTVEPKAFAEWIDKAPKIPVRDKSPAGQYQVKHAGPEETTVSGGGVEVRADGARISDAHLLEVKHVTSPGSSPYIPGSSCPEPIRLRVHEELIQQLRRYAAIIRDPKTPAVGVEIITNDLRAASFFEGLMTALGLQGRVVVRT